MRRLPFRAVFCPLLFVFLFSTGCAFQPDRNGVAYKWNTMPWGSCFSLISCGEGHRVRQVTCRDATSGYTVEDSNCDPADRPPTSKDCFRVCDHHRHMLRWQIEPWSPCRTTRPVAACVGASQPGVARRQVTCVLTSKGRVVDSSACENFWDRPEDEMTCSMDVGTMLECPQDCVSMKRNVSCPPHTCPSQNKWNTEYREITDVLVSPSEGGAPCPDSGPDPVCPDTFSDEGCRDAEEGQQRYMLKLDEWGPCESSSSTASPEVRISIRLLVGISRRNITCITDQGEDASTSLCNVVRGPKLWRHCVVPLPCLTSPWSEWRVKQEGCITSGGRVHAEVRTRYRRLVQMPVGAGAEPCPPLFEERKVFQDLPSCYKYQWQPLEWSGCELRSVDPHGKVTVARPTCESGLQYRNIVCVRASDMSPVSAELCREQRPPAVQRCEVPCRRDCQVSHWSRWGPCNFLRDHNILETMHDGYRVRERSVLVSPGGGGAECPHLHEADICLTVELFAWRYGKWTNCTLADPRATCGQGNRTRDKTCVKVDGAPLDDFLCDRHHFPEVSEKCTLPCPGDCVLSEWSDWSACSMACNDGVRQGEKTRNRTLLAEAGEGGRGCRRGGVRGSTHCNEHSCHPFRWTAGPWGECGAREEGGCGGGGVQRRTVECTHGREEAEEFELCDYIKMPETERECHIPCPIDCVTTNFTDWSPCEGNCDTGGVQSRRRLVLQSSQHGGRACPESLLEERACTEAMDATCLRRGPTYRWNTTSWSSCHMPAEGQRCGMGFHFRNVSCLDQRDHRAVEPFLCLDAPPPSAVRSCEVTCSTKCVLTAWSGWTECGHEYDATRQRSREIVGPTSDDIEKCRLTSKLLEDEKCPPVQQSLVTFDEQNLHWMSCIVEEGNNSSSGGQSCGAGTKYRFGETGTGPGLQEDFCFQDCPLDCRMSGWAEWSECDVPCGQGFRERSRDVIGPANHLGRPCPEGLINMTTEIQRDVCRIVCADYRWLAGGWSPCFLDDEEDQCGNGTQYRSVKCLEKRTEREVPELKCDPLLKPDSVSPCTLHCPGECVTSPWKITKKCPQPCSESDYQEQTRTILRAPHATAAPCPGLIWRRPCVLNETCHSHSLVAGPWGSCVLPRGALCGEGVRRKPVWCVRSDGRQVDAVQCEKTHQSLTLKEPTSKPCYVDCPVDCQVTEWSTWNDTRCTACGETGGVRVRSRGVLQAPSDAGRPCPSETEQRMPCPFKACYHWKHSEWSACDMEGADCGFGVRHRVVECIRYDGLRVDGGRCLTLNVTFAREGWMDPAWLAKAQDDSHEQEICRVPCPGTCVLSEWSRWSHCHKNCRIGQTVGYQTSSRKVLLSSRNITDSCTQMLLRTRPCWHDDCNFFRWKLKNGSLICEGRDGITVQGGCTPLPLPCQFWCEKSSGRCDPGGLCRCESGTVLAGPTSAPCPAGGPPRTPANHSAPTEIRLKYFPDDSQVSFWMYAMISIGSAFVIFVVVTMYLMCRSSLRQRSISVERQPSVRRRVAASKHLNTRDHDLKR